MRKFQHLVSCFEQLENSGLMFSSVKVISFSVRFELLLNEFSSGFVVETQPVEEL